MMRLGGLIEVRRRLAPPANEFAGWYQKPAKAGCGILDMRQRIEPQPAGCFWKQGTKNGVVMSEGTDRALNDRAVLVVGGGSRDGGGDAAAEQGRQVYLLDSARPSAGRCTCWTTPSPPTRAASA